MVVLNSQVCYLGYICSMNTELITSVFIDMNLIFITQPTLSFNFCLRIFKKIDGICRTF